MAIYKDHVIYNVNLKTAHSSNAIADHFKAVAAILLEKADIINVPSNDSLSPNVGSSSASKSWM